MTAAERAVAERVDAAVRSRAQSLDLSGLGLKTVPALPPDLSGISELRLSRNRLKTIPASVLEMTRLEVLDLGGNWLSEVAPEIGKLQSLARLDLSENQLTGIPAELFSCPELQELSLYGNQVTTLPAASVPLQNLWRLDVSANHLAALRGLATAFPCLRDLDASGNALAALDEDVAGLSSLRILNLSGNQLTTVAALAGMSWIRELYLDDNKLAEIPLAIASFAELRVFSAADNPLGALPPAFDRVNASKLKSEARSAFQANISGGDTGKDYFNLPSLFFDFTLALSGLVAVRRFIDLYFKRAPATAGTTAVMRFPDGVVIELSHLSRKATLDLVRQHEDSLAGGKATIQLDPVRRGETESALDLLTSVVARVPAAEVVPRAAGQPNITLINGNLVQNIHQEVKEMGDRITIDRNSGVINLKSKLENVTQTISASSGDEESKAQLIALMKQLSEALDKVPPEQKLDAEAVSDAAEDVVAKATKPNPNKKSVEISGKGLLEAAKGIAGVVPIAIEIVKAIGHFAGLG